MQRLSVVMVIAIMVFASVTADAQSSVIRTIEPYRLAIAYSKTSNLIFPYAIKSVDRGSADVLAQKAGGVENILQIKAGKKGFERSNISVVTADGKFYSFLVDYADEPSALNISFENDSVSLEVKKEKALLDGAVNEAAFDSAANAVRSAKTFLHRHTRCQKVSLSLKSIYLHRTAMWFTLGLQNKSLINYRPEFVRFFIRDKKRVKRMAIQEVELTPLYAQAMPDVAGGKSVHLAIAFTPFTIPGTKELVIQVTEQNGGRSLALRAGHRLLLKTRRLQ